MLFSIRTLSSEAFTVELTPGFTKMPPPVFWPLLRTIVSLMKTWVVPAVVVAISIPEPLVPRKLLMVHFSTWRDPRPPSTLIPTRPVPSPSMSRPRSTTLLVVVALIMMAFVPDTSTPASKPSLEMVIDLLIVTPPKPPGSRTLISPAVAVFEIAPAKVLQGAVRLLCLTETPTTETQVRVACAWAEDETRQNRTEAVSESVIFLMILSLQINWPLRPIQPWTG